MIIRKLKYSNFRNLKDGELIFGEGMNIITGENGQGKTNLIEALWLFNGVKSFRNAKDKELIAFQKSHAEVEVDFYASERLQNARIRLLNGKRENYLNEIKKPSSAYLMGKITTVVFSPENLSMVKGGPSLRRKFIDSAICQVKPKYSALLARYNRVLDQRNALLKKNKNYADFSSVLEIWDNELATVGGKIIAERISYIDTLSRKACVYHQGISHGKEVLSLSYRNRYDTQTPLAQMTEDFRLSLQKHRNEDIQYGFTTHGVHRDDVEITVNGKNTRLYASQGQQRSAVLSLKLAQASLIDEITQSKPAILLDDVLSELDNDRQNFLLNELYGTQVFLTCCEYPKADKRFSGKVFYVSDGVITPQGE